MYVVVGFVRLPPHIYVSHGEGTKQELTESIEKTVDFSIPPLVYMEDIHLPR